MRSIDLVRRRLEERNCCIIRDRGDHFGAQCAGHDDRNPSLDVRWVRHPSGAKCTVVKCHAGCQTEDVLGALALTFRDLWDGAVTRGVRGNPYVPRFENSLVHSNAKPSWDRLKAQEAAGEIEALPVQMGPLRPRATTDEKLLVARLERLFGIYANEDRRPAPVSVRFAAELMGLDPRNEAQKQRANRALRRLIDSGAIRWTGSLKRRPGMRFASYPAASPPRLSRCS